MPKFKIKDDIEENFKFLNNVAETRDDLKKELIEILRDVNSNNKEELLKYLINQKRYEILKDDLESIMKEINNGGI